MIPAAEYPPRVLGLLTLLLLGLVLAIAIATWLVMHRLRRPPRRTYAVAVARNIPGDPSETEPPRAFRAFTFDAPTRAGRSEPRACWEITGENPDGPIIVCSSGWGDSKVGAIPRLPALAPCASSLIAWDIAGIGESPGLCRLGSRADALELAALVETLPDAPVVLYGWSLGGGLSIAAAAELCARGRPPLAVIAEAPYRMPWTPARSVLALNSLPHTINLPIAMALLGLRLGEGPRWRRFDRAALARRVSCPMLLLHGDADTICPLDDSRAIAASAPSATLITIRGAGHNNLWTEEPWKTHAHEAVTAFLKERGRA